MPALRARDALFSHVSNEPCREPDSARVINVWQNLNCNTLHQYLDLFLKTEVLVLTEIFEE